MQVLAITIILAGSLLWTIWSFLTLATTVLGFDAVLHFIASALMLLNWVFFSPAIRRRLSNRSTSLQLLVMYVPLIALATVPYFAFTDDDLILRIKLSESKLTTRCEHLLQINKGSSRQRDPINDERIGLFVVRSSRISNGTVELYINGFGLLNSSGLLFDPERTIPENYRRKFYRRRLFGPWVLYKNYD